MERNGQAVRMEELDQTEAASAVDSQSNGAVAESKADSEKEICDARKEISTLERQIENLNECLDDITKDHRLMTCGKRPVNGARACGFCRALIAANRSRCLGCGHPAPGTEGYQRARAVMAVTLERHRARSTCGKVHRRDGDWDCSYCNTVNFSSRVECFKCKRPKPIKAV